MKYKNGLIGFSYFQHFETTYSKNNFRKVMENDRETLTQLAKCWRLKWYGILEYDILQRTL